MLKRRGHEPPAHDIKFTWQVSLLLLRTHRFTTTHMNNHSRARSRSPCVQLDEIKMAAMQLKDRLPEPAREAMKFPSLLAAHGLVLHRTVKWEPLEFAKVVDTGERFGIGARSGSAHFDLREPPAMPYCR